MPSPRLALVQLNVGAHNRAFVWGLVALAERFLAALLLLTLAPALTAAMAAVALRSRQSPLIAHCRVGRGGRCVWVLKLRTMRNSVSKRSACFVERLPPILDVCPPLKTASDPRVMDPFAAFCRRYSIDELPQLWQVVRGELALVGPRPLTEPELRTHYGRHTSLILARTPGLTGLWQIRGRSRLTYAQRSRLDLFLVRNWSFGLYCRILFATIPCVLSGHDAW